MHPALNPHGRRFWPGRRRSCSVKVVPGKMEATHLQFIAIPISCIQEWPPLISMSLKSVYNHPKVLAWQNHLLRQSLQNLSFSGGGVCKNEIFSLTKEQHLSNFLINQDMWHSPLQNIFTSSLKAFPQTQLFSPLSASFSLCDRADLISDISRGRMTSA